jgi:hypothetical protein
MIRISIYSVNLAGYISRCALQHHLAAAALKGIMGYIVIISDIRGLKPNQPALLLTSACYIFTVHSAAVNGIHLYSSKSLTVVSDYCYRALLTPSAGSHLILFSQHVS